jgi:dihydrofolate reductase
MSLNRKVVVFIASSLDGYIATEDESLEWLFKVEGEGDNGYSEFYQTVDTVIMGRRTYDWIIKHEPTNFPYQNKECFVFSTNRNQDSEHVQFIQTANIEEFIEKLKNRAGKNIWIVGGGELLHHFLKNNLIDELILTLAPTLIGKGIPLFRERDSELELVLKRTRTFNQFVELHYEFKK